MLNHNLAFIDTINDLVYSAASLPEGSQGTATLFLDDVRISTNVRLFAGTRALGTRVSEAVRQAVLGEGRIWLDRAFVVNDWYVSAYEPVVDTRGRRIGMLYVGFFGKAVPRRKAFDAFGHRRRVHALGSSRRASPAVVGSKHLFIRSSA